MQPDTSVPLLPALGPQRPQIYNHHEDHQEEPSTRHPSKSTQGTRRTKRRHHGLPTNRLLVGRPRGCSKLIENFSEFLNSRNVINRYSRYDKIVNDDALNLGGSDGGLNHHHHLHGTSRQRQPVFRCCDHRDRHKGTRAKPSGSARVRLLLGALLSRNQRNKGSLLVSLLRAPIVLAALFSLVLVATLLTLYTLSFHHLSLPQLIYSHPNGAYSSGPGRPMTTGSSAHHINSRHLQRTGPIGSGLGAPEEKEDGFDRALTVQTECGAFVGAPESSAIVFAGIPYASPPLGERRWARPRPVWLDERLCQRNQTLGASERRPHCAQLSPVTRRFSGQEDCLYLDIYAPKLDQVQKLPVMVYIHGGFLAFGSSGQGRVNWMRARPGGQLAAELNVVLVAFNYRLQALGFMTLSQLAQNNGPDGGEGNYGLWDQLVALNWIKRNIESFGGDPDNIVLFGPDSASALPLALLTGDSGAAAAEVAGSDLMGQQSGTFGRKMVLGAARGSIGGSGEATTGDEEATKYHHHGRQQQHPGWIHSTRDLFRAVWLTNPSVYYEIPYEVANRHYQRLFLNQSPCQTLASSPTTNSSSSNNNNNNNNKPPPGADNDNNSTHGQQAAGSHQNGPSNQSTTSEQQQQQSGKRMLQCLMDLSAEQVVRRYLGQDDPSYRLDDQNSLPIHGVFADQFVTIDRELVRDSYPFIGAGLDQEKRPASEGPEAKMQANLNQAAADFRQAKDSGTLEDHYTNNNSSRPKANEWRKQAPDNHPEAQYSGSAAGRAANDDYDDDDNCVGPICAQGGKDLLLGSTAQAVEYWPCPRDLHQWTWDDFRRYVNISLNSFVADTYRRASELYGVPPISGAPIDQPVLMSDTAANEPAAAATPSTATRSTNNNNSSQQQQNPIKTYLTMVSDIRQICPINELAQSLALRRHRVHRYIVENGPTGIRLFSIRQDHPLDDRRSPSNTRGVQQEASMPDGPQEQDRKLPEYAFHTWDLTAFFGFEFEPDYLPSPKDLKFQSQIRGLVRDFVHRRGIMRSDKSDRIKEAQSDNLQAMRYTLFGGDGSMRLHSQDQHKPEECQMWRRHLGQSYAWVS